MTTLDGRPYRSMILMVCAVAAIMLLSAAALRLPYGYYTLLRLVVALSAGFMAWKSVMAGGLLFCVFGLVFGIVCLLYNPIFIVHLSRHNWIPINIITAALFFIGGFIRHYFATRET